VSRAPRPQGVSGATAGVPGPLGLIAGNGRFPFMLAAAARRSGRKVVAVAIREETDPTLAAEVDEIHWVGLGQLGRALEALRRAGAHEAVMAGQVKHRQIFADIVPDLKLMGVLARVAFKNTDSLIGAVADAFAREGIELRSSVELLVDHLADAGRLTRRAPDRSARRDIAYGIRIARHLGALDLGQAVVIKQCAAVALEAMEGTDAIIKRAGELAGAGCTVVKLAKPRQDLRFDVPVVGIDTLSAMKAAGATTLALEAGRTLLIDKPAFLSVAEQSGIAVWGISQDELAQARA
jgi:UDP-2,3-diacylglucosamine hydrolase